MTAQQLQSFEAGIQNAQTIQDLNIVHALEDAVKHDPELTEQYGEFLLKAVLHDYGYQGADWIIFATASQRCNALTAMIPILKSY